MFSEAIATNESHPKKPSPGSVDRGNHRLIPLTIACIVTSSNSADEQTAVEAATNATSLFCDVGSRNLRSDPGWITALILPFLWWLMLAQIARVVVEFTPLRQSSRSAKEFLARVFSPKASASNPDCQVEAVVKDSGAAFVEVEFTNKLKQRIATKGLTADQIFQRIQERSQVLQAQEVLKKVGISSVALEVGSGPDANKVGATRRVPIT